MEICNLIKNNIIPREELDRVFDESDSASAEMDCTFLCFEDVYEDVLANTTPDMTILDLGCAYAPQAFYFKDYAKYIGVDLPFENDVRFKTDNSEFYLMSIQKFIKEVLPGLDLDLSKTVAVCSYVPDKEAGQMVADTFPIHLVTYPGNDMVKSRTLGNLYTQTMDNKKDIIQISEMVKDKAIKYFCVDVENEDDKECDDIFLD